MEEDGIENNFPATFRTRETADLFMALIIRLLKNNGRASMVLPDGFFFGEGIKTRIKQKLLEECNLHTIVRLPNGVFKHAVNTFDGFAVRFRKGRFNHCFFESSNRNGVKDKFSKKRAERIDWIKAALEDPNAELYMGWDKKKKRDDKRHRVALVVNDYVVVIRLHNNKKAQFVTAYVADSLSTLNKIKRNPKWVP